MQPGPPARVSASRQVLVERAAQVALVEKADHLGHRRFGPDVEDWRGLHRRVLDAEALRGLLWGFARALRAQVALDPILAVDPGKLEVAIERLEVPGEEGHHRDREEALVAAVPQQGAHQVGVRRVGVRSGAGAVRVAIAGEDAQLQAAGLGHALEHRGVTATVGGPLLGDQEDLRRAVRLLGQPFEGGGLGLGQPKLLVALAQVTAIVAPLSATGGLAPQALGAGDVGEVLLEGHALGEALRGQADLGLNRH